MEVLVYVLGSFILAFLPALLFGRQSHLLLSIVAALPTAAAFLLISYVVFFYSTYDLRLGYIGFLIVLVLGALSGLFIGQRSGRV